MASVGSNAALNADIQACFAELQASVDGFEFNDCTHFLRAFEACCYRHVRNKFMCKNLIMEMTASINRQDVKFLLKFIDRPTGAASCTPKKKQASQSTPSSEGEQQQSGDCSFVEGLISTLVCATKDFSLDSMEKIRIEIEQYCLISKQNFNIAYFESYCKGIGPK